MLALRREEEREILGRWSLGLQLKNLNKGFNTKKPRDLSFSRWFAGCLFLILTYKGIVLASIGANRPKTLINSLTAMRVLAGTKNSRPVGLILQ